MDTGTTNSEKLKYYLLQGMRDSMPRVKVCWDVWRESFASKFILQSFKSAMACSGLTHQYYDFCTSHQKTPTDLIGMQ